MTTKTKKPVKKFRIGQLVEYRPDGSNEPWSPAKVISWSHDAEDGFITYHLTVGGITNFCAGDWEMRIPKTKRLMFRDFIKAFRTEYKRLTKKTFKTFNELSSSRHPDLMGLAEAHEENWSPKKTAKSYVKATKKT